MKRVAVAEARAYFRDLVDEVRRRHERVKITRYGKTIACLVPSEDGTLLEECADELQDCHRRSARTRAKR